LQRDVTVAGRPVLRQYLDLTDPGLRDWAGMLGDARVLATALLAGPGVQARTVVAAPTAVAQRLSDHAVLVTVLAQDAADAAAELTRLCAESG
jgi:urease accessory protein